MPDALQQILTSPRIARMLRWSLIALAGLTAWTLFMLGAVLQRHYLVLFFPSAWCLWVAVRQFREINEQRA